MVPSDTDKGGTGRLEAYPDAQLDRLTRTAKSRYLRHADGKGDDRAWLQDEARWHIWKACDELFQARDHAHHGYHDDAAVHFADALNHMLFAMDITWNSRQDAADSGRDRGGMRVLDGVLLLLVALVVLAATAVLLGVLP